MKYSILMPYYKRAGHLHNTLMSFAHHYSNRQDFEIIIIEDIKNKNIFSEHEMLKKVIKVFDRKLKIVHIQTEFPKVFNPSILFNVGAALSNGEYLVITNPECFHKVNILSGFDEEFSYNKGIYIVCGCESVQKPNFWIQKFNDFSYEHHRWYQHSVHRNVQYHFCSAIHRDMFSYIGKFDEQYAEGIAYEDNDFIETIRKFKVPIITRDDLLVLHIEHEKVYQMKEIRNRRALVQKNKTIFERKWQPNQRGVV